MQEHSFHPQRVSHQAGVLASGTTEALQGIAGNIIAALYGYFFNCIGHVLNSNAQKSFGQILNFAFRLT